ncbi:transposase [Azospirillum brasilense]|nr:transposase [Azospirillum brasilense]
MPAQRVSMRKIREVLRLTFACGLSKRQVAPIAGVSASTVREYVTRAKQAGLGWPLPDEFGDEELERLLFPPVPDVPADQRPQPDWAALHRELRRPGVTLLLLWEEYRAQHSNGFSYSWFCDCYRAWAGRVSPTLRQVHPAGERLFVDYAGHSIDLVDPRTGVVHAAQIFIAVLGASNYTFATATLSQGLPDWIAAHTAAFAFFGGVPRQVVCDNLKAGVTKPCRYEPTVNATYREMAGHYGVAVVPTRVRKPRDKAKVEVGVQVVERWVLARLRKQRFLSLAELNAAIAGLLDDLNSRVMRHLGASRRELFEQLDRPALGRLPAEPYEYAEWLQRRVGIDYHVEVERHFYSVPCRLLKEAVEVRLTAAAVEVFHKGKRVAVHARSSVAHRHTTQPDHMPSAHRRFQDWTHERVLNEAAAAGPHTAAMVEAILREREHPERGFRSCVGILRLAQHYGADRLEAACARGLAIGARSYSSLQSILKSGLDRRPATTEPAVEAPTLAHANIRGARYYH